MAQKFRWHTKRIKGFMQPKRWLTINKKRYQIIGNETFVTRKMAKQFQKSQLKKIKEHEPRAKARIVGVGDKFAVYYTPNKIPKRHVVRD